MTRGNSTSWLILLTLFLVPPAFVRAGAQTEEEMECLCSFEEGAEDRAWTAGGSTAETVTGGPVGKSHLHWSSRSDRLWFNLRITLGMDLTGYSKLVFHLKADGELSHRNMRIHLRSRRGRYSIRMPAAGSGWKRITLPFASFEPAGKPDPTRIKAIEIHGFGWGKPMSLHLDHICLVKDEQGWEGGIPRCLDFEDPTHIDRVDASYSKVKAVPGPGKKGTAAAWTLKKGQEVAYLDYSPVPRDIREKAALRFQLRADRKVPAGTLRLRIYDRKNSYISLALKEIDTRWTATKAPLGYFQESGAFNPADVAYLEWIVWDTKAVTFYLDDIAWVAGKAGPASWRQGRGPTLAINKAETGFALEADHSTAHLRTTGKNHGSLVWRVPAGKSWVCLNITCLPRDIRPFRALSLKVKASRKTGPDEIHIRLTSSDEDYLYLRMPPLDKRWKTLTLSLPDFLATRSFDPLHIRELELVGWDLKPVTFTFTRIALEKGRRQTSSWRPTEKDLKVRIFGKSRAKRTHRVKTRHFVVWTDSRAALGKFLRILDSHVDLVRKKLDLPAVKNPIPVYIFRNPEGYTRFCVRYAGMTRTEAEYSAGHGCGRYFTTYYTHPNSPVIVHELTHTLVHRIYGPHGGSWFQEGFAEYVESAFRKRNPVKEFAVHLRNERHKPLEAFITEKTLAFARSQKDSSNVTRMYQQAAAFFSFLKDGPHANKFAELVKRLTPAYSDPGSRRKILEKLYGMSLKALEKEWIAWSVARR